MEIGRWGGRQFVVSANVIRGFTGLTVKGSAETEDKTENNQKYVSRKNGKPAEINLVVMLHGALNVDVRAEALAFVSDAQAGKTDYLYISNTKLVPCQVMLTDAEVTETVINPAGQWVSAQVKLTMKQCSKLDGSKGGSGSGGSAKQGIRITQHVTVKEELTTGGVGRMTTQGFIETASSAGSGELDTMTYAQPALQTAAKTVQAGRDATTAKTADKGMNDVLRHLTTLLN